MRHGAGKIRRVGMVAGGPVGGSWLVLVELYMYGPMIKGWRVNSDRPGDSMWQNGLERTL